MVVKMHCGLCFGPPKPIQFLTTPVTFSLVSRDWVDYAIYSALVCLLADGIYVYIQTQRHIVMQPAIIIVRPHCTSNV